MEPFIKRIRVQNFKSFADMDLELGRFNVIIGANAAGKSNLVQVFRFLRDIRRYGLDNAVSMQGGLQYIRNLRRVDKSTVIEIETKFSKGVRVYVPIKRNMYSTGGKWRLEFKAEGQKVRIIEDSWTFYVSDRAEPGLDAFVGDGGELHQEGSVSVTRGNGRLHFDVDFESDLKDVLDKYMFESHPKKNELLVEFKLLEYFFPQIFGFENMGTYDFNPKLAGGSAPIKGIPILEDDGSNLSMVLKNILSDDDRKATLHALVADLLPFVKSIGVRDSVKSVMFTAVEEHLEKTPLPSPLLADGTVNVVALIVALYLEEMRVVIIEEPERNMHPHLMSKAVGMMKDASEKRQIIITTHSPEIVRYAGLESLYAIKRGPEGFSEISRPATNKEIAGFLEKDMDMGEMHVQNMLEW